MSDPIAPNRKRLHLVISGLVQGVGFRYSTQVQARQWGIVGWVRNLSDGRVEAALEGEPEDLDRLVKWCRQGPPAAQVRDVTIEEEKPQGDREFEILH